MLILESLVKSNTLEKAARSALPETDIYATRRPRPFSICLLVCALHVCKCEQKQTPTILYRDPTQTDCKVHSCVSFSSGESMSLFFFWFQFALSPPYKEMWRNLCRPGAEGSCFLVAMLKGTRGCGGMLPRCTSPIAASLQAG